ncbi:hypothetical protein B0T21DRAFT_378130 [Apiosordaria backusii]|uniref:Uncharacterized protein n=1 Tax=Apiosordaria backusii TaxID=314023 RepID=A0AA39ZSU1_9PEZI|nr:hypothetical protein B0T21DRAFT_378130 [Apiosordaria backusii]
MSMPSITLSPVFPITMTRISPLRAIIQRALRSATMRRTPCPDQSVRTAMTAASPPISSRPLTTMITLPAGAMKA